MPEFGGVAGADLLSPGFLAPEQALGQDAGPPPEPGATGSPPPAQAEPGETAPGETAKPAFDPVLPAEREVMMSVATTMARK